MGNNLEEVAARLFSASLMVGEKAAFPFFYSFALFRFFFCEPHNNKEK